jgi:hypothetical protein
MSRIKIGIVTRGLPTSLDYYRTVGFWPYFADTQTIDIREVNWWNVPHFDVVLVPRPTGDEGSRACEIVKELGKTLWLDFDDDLLHLPDDFEADKEKIRKVVTRCAGLADLVICSTQAVADLFRGKRTIVRKNMFNDFVFRFDPVFSGNSTFGFRGTERVHKWNVSRFRKIFEEGDWIFWGGGMKEFYGKHLNELTFIDFMVSLRNRAPGVMVKPLVDIPHNRAKSNCAWLEATYAGAVCVAPDWEEWSEPGITTYRDVDHCAEVLKYLIYDISMRKELFNESVKAIREKCLVSRFEFRQEDWL